MLFLAVLTVTLASALAQETAPADWEPTGCAPVDIPLGCPSGSTTCIAPDRANVYKTVTARTWWHCARACQPVTLCKNWTYRHGQKKCYLLKSCCVKEATGFQSGDESCPV